MSWKKIILLLALLGILFGAIILVNKSEKEKKAREGKLYTISKEQVFRLELARDAERFTFVRNGGQWEMTEPIKTRADKAAVDNILDEFCSLKYDREVEENAADLKAYGLDKPRIELKLFAKDQTKPLQEVRIGMTNKIDSSAYTALAGSQQVVLIPSYRREYLEKDVFAFRDKKFTNFSFADVKAFSYTYEAAAFSFAKKDSRWMVEKPVFSVGDDLKISGIVGKAAALEAKAFTAAASPEKLKEFGFDKPLIDAVFTLGDRTQAIKVAKKEDAYYAYTPGFGEICEIDSEFVDKFPKETKELRNQKVIQFYPFEAREISVKTPQIEFQAKRNKEDRWELAVPSGKGKIKEFELNNLLSELETLLATDFIDQPAKDTRFVTTIKIKVDERTNQADKSPEIQFSEPQGAVVIARNPKLPYEFKVGKEILDKIPKNLDSLIEKVQPAAVK